MRVLFLASMPQSPSWTRAKSDLGQEARNRAKGNLKCVPKTIMGPEDCASLHVSFLLKSVRAQVHLWNIHTLSLSDFSCTDLLQNWQLCWNLLYSRPEPLLQGPPLPLLCLCGSTLWWFGLPAAEAVEDFCIPNKYLCIVSSFAQDGLRE